MLLSTCYLARQDQMLLCTRPVWYTNTGCPELPENKMVAVVGGLLCAWEVLVLFVASSCINVSAWLHSSCSRLCWLLAQRDQMNTQEGLEPRGRAVL